MDIQILSYSEGRVVSKWEVKALFKVIEERKIHVDEIKLTMDDFDLILGK